MVTSDARTPDEYIAALPRDRRAAVSGVRDTLPEEAFGSSRRTRAANGAANP